MTTQMTLEFWCYDFISRLEYHQEIEDLKTFIALITVGNLVRMKISQNKFIDELEEQLRLLHTKLVPEILEDKIQGLEDQIKQQDLVIQMLKDENNKQIAEKEELNNIIKELNEKKIQLEEKLSAQQNGFDYFDEKFQEEFEQNKQLEEKIDQLERKLESAQLQIEAYQSGIKNLTDKAAFVTEEELLKLKLFGDIFKSDPKYDVNKQRWYNLLSNTGYLYNMLQTAYEKIDTLDINTYSESENKKQD